MESDFKFTSFSSPEPVVSWSRGRLQIKPSGSGDENVFCLHGGVEDYSLDI